MVKCAEHYFNAVSILTFWCISSWRFELYMNLNSSGSGVGLADIQVLDQYCFNFTDQHFLAV